MLGLQTRMEHGFEGFTNWGIFTPTNVNALIIVFLNFYVPLPPQQLEKLK